RDEGVSGAKDRRPALDRLMADARARKFDVVIVARFDRFARSVSHLLRALEEFKALGIDFVSLNESIDTSTPMGKMVFTILAAVAELERSIITERVHAGVHRARKEGKNIRQAEDHRGPGASPGTAQGRTEHTHDRFSHGLNEVHSVQHRERQLIETFQRGSGQAYVVSLTAPRKPNRKPKGDPNHPAETKHPTHPERSRQCREGSTVCIVQPLGKPGFFPPDSQDR